MANRVTAEDIKRMNELYYTLKNYAEVARQTGWSASTVRKYIISNFTPINTNQIIKFDQSKLAPPSFELFAQVKDFGDLCVLSDKEKEEIKELWKEILV